MLNLNSEFINKFKGLVVDEYKVRFTEEILGQGKEGVVFKVIHLIENEIKALKIMWTNPMFLLNELNFIFLPRSDNPFDRITRNEEIMGKIFSVCEEHRSPGLSMRHMNNIYTRLILGLCHDFDLYQTTVHSDLTRTFCNEEFVDFFWRTLNRLEKAKTNIENSKENSSLISNLSFEQYYVLRGLAANSEIKESFNNAIKVGGYDFEKLALKDDYLPPEDRFLSKLGDAALSFSFIFDLEYWEYSLLDKVETLKHILKDLQMAQEAGFLNASGTFFRPNQPTSLLALIFSENFFGKITENDSNGNFYDDLHNDSLPKLMAEDRLEEFLDDLEYREIADDLSQELEILKSTLDSLQLMFASDMTDDYDWVASLDEDILSKYINSRDTLLISFKRFIRTIDTHLNA